MSFEAMAWAVKQRGVGSSSKLVLMILANHSNGHTGQCNPKIKNIATECEMCDSTVKANIKKLQDVGLIRIENKFYDGVQLPNQYWLNIHDENWGGGSKSDPGVGQNLATYIVDRTCNNEPQVADAPTSVVGGKKKTEKKKYKHDDDVYVTAMFLDETIRKWNSTYKGKTDSEIQSWCDDFDKMTRIDNVTSVRQRCFIAAIHEDEGDGNGFCWRVNITSASKFRKQYNDGKLVRYESRAKEIYEENFK